MPSYDDPDIIAGQGTTGLEIAEQAAEHGLMLDDVVVCCSGGGLTAGIAIAMAQLAPQAGVWTAEPAAYDDHRRSLAAGRRQRNEPGAPPSICDALLAPIPGELTFAINQPLLRGGLAVSDDEVRRAIVFAARTLKLVVEPGGAVALAAVLCRQARRPRTHCCGDPVGWQYRGRAARRTPDDELTAPATLRTRPP